MLIQQILIEVTLILIHLSIPLRYDLLLTARDLIRFSHRGHIYSPCCHLNPLALMTLVLDHWVAG